MKKFLALLLALVMVFALAACGEPATDPSDAPSGGDDTQTSDAPEGGDSTATGSVYYLNFKPEADAAWQELAALYTEQTGVTVKVVTAASGEYSSTLTAEMDKSCLLYTSPRPCRGGRRRRARARPLSAWRRWTPPPLHGGWRERRPLFFWRRRARLRQNEGRQ